MMDSKKPNSLDDVINRGGVKAAEDGDGGRAGKAKGKKIRTLISIDEELLARIDRHIIGNRSAWLAKVATEYLDSHDLQ